MPKNIPVKPLSEVEVKEKVTENDKILILDSDTNEARLADKEELRGFSGIEYIDIDEYEDLDEEKKMDGTSYFLFDDVDEIMKVLLRPYNNLLFYNEKDELYCDLQFENGMTPVSVFPVGIVVGNVKKEDGWNQSGVLLNALTAEGQYLRWLYGDDGILYFDGGLGVFKAMATESLITEKISELRSQLSEVAFSGKSSDLDNDAGFNSVPVLTEEEYNQRTGTAGDDKRYFTYETYTI